MYVRYRLAHLWRDSHENLQGDPGPSREGFSQKKIFVRPHLSDQGQKGVPGVLLQPQPCVLEKSLLNKSCRAPQKTLGRVKSKLKLEIWLLSYFSLNILTVAPSIVIKCNNFSC